MYRENKNLMYAYIFDNLGVYDEIDFMCHYANDEDYKEWYKKGNNGDNEIWYKVFNEQLWKILKGKEYPFYIEGVNKND